MTIKASLLAQALFLTFVTPTLAADGSQGAPSSLPSVVQINEIGNTAHVALNIGDTLRVTLKATVSTGYGWQIAANDNALLEAGEKTNLPAKTKALGAPGRQSFTFKAKAVGHDRLLLAYVRPWEKDTLPARTLSLELVIRDVGLRGDPTFAVRPAGKLIARYTGKLPCADCSSIRETLSLYSPGPNQFVNTYYVTTMTYMGAPNGNVTNVSAGKWFLKRGTPFDANAVVYSLNLDSTDREQNYLLKGETLTPLDQDLNLIHAPLDQSLHRIL